MKTKIIAVLAAVMASFGWQVESQTNDTIWSKSLVVRQGDLQIQVELTSNEHFWPNNYPRTASYLDGFFKIKLANLSNTRKINFTTWRGKTIGGGRDYATLTDDNGNVYKLQPSINSTSTGGDGDGAGICASVTENSECFPASVTFIFVGVY